MPAATSPARPSTSTAAGTLDHEVVTFVTGVTRDACHCCDQATFRSVNASSSDFLIATRPATRDLSHVVSTYGVFRMKSAIAVFAVTASAFALPAAAQMNMSAFYVGASIGQSKFKNGCSGCDDKDTAWRLLAGYQFHPNFAAELGYHKLGEASGSGATAKATAWELVGLG